VRAHGGARFYTASGTSTGVSLAAGGGSWSNLSDRNTKENFQAVDPQEVLAQVAQLPITSWNYKSQKDEIRHLGPVAQDFSRLFSLGEDDTHITTVDVDGVALAAIQGLYEISQDQAELIKDLQAENESLRNQLGEPIGNPSGTFSILVYGLTGLVLLLLVGLIWVLLRLRNLGVLEVAHGK
jgi:hypothetical protein